MFFSPLRLLLMSKSRRANARTFRPAIDVLEDRRLLATFFVDDNGPLGPNKFNKIQDAVNAAFANGPAKDTIQVKPGVYNENVVVNTSVTIQGIGKPLVDPVSDGAVSGPVSGFDLRATDIVISGFRIGDIDGDTTAGGGDGSVGITTSSSFSGYKILGNTIEKNVIGIYLNTTIVGPKASEVTGNLLQDNNVGFGVLPSAGNGIYSDQGAKNVKIQSNTFLRHGNAEVAFVGPADTQFQIYVQNNTLRDGGGIFFISVDGGSRIVGNNISRSAFNAIELAGNNNGVLIQGNVLNNVGIQGYTGIYLHDSNPSGPFGPNVANVIQFNTVINAGLSGIRIRDSNNNIVKGNVVLGTQGNFLGDPAWGNGIGIQNGQGNRVDSNTVRNSARHGIYVDATSANNLITANNSFFNAKKVPGAFDYNDDSPGPPPAGGTAGTSNTYKRNAGKTQNKPGLIN